MKKSKIKNRICIILLFMAFIGIMCIQVHAAELKLEPKPYSDKNPFQFKRSDTWTSEGKTIQSYDVSENGQIAIAFSNRTIGVFDHDMNFLYQLSFETNGAFGVMWLDESLLFVDIRSNTAIACGNDGLPEYFYEIVGPSNYDYRVITERSRKQGSDQYYCIKSGGSNDPLIRYGYYTMLKRTSKEGVEEILYETTASFEQKFVGQGGLFAIMAVVYVGVFIIIWAFKKRGNKQTFE